MRARSPLAITAAVVLGAGAMVVGLSGGAIAEEVPADIADYEYEEPAQTISEGDTVTWTNQDAAPHTVTSDDGGPLDSPTLQQGDSWSFTFTEAGTYSFYCVIHPDMVGEITVEAAAAPPTSEPEPTTTTTMDHGEDPPDDPAEPEPTDPEPEPEGPPECNTNAVAAALEPFWAHFTAAHLETSPGQQAAEALDVDQYALTHTVLFGNMLDPLVGVLMGSGGALEPFMAHFNAAHLETSPGQQVAEALDVDQYAKTHTVLFENMLAPAVGPAAGDC